MILYGKNPVLERIKSRPGTIKKLILKQKTDLSEIVRAAKEKKVGFISMPEDEFMDMANNVNAQGVIAEVDEFSYLPFAQALQIAIKDGIIPVFLDGITDPQNLGSTIRNLACLGRFIIVIPEHNSVEVNETVLRVASGGENYLYVSKIINTVKGIEDAKKMGFTVAGAVPFAKTSVMEAKLDLPLAVVLGSEGKGIRPGILKVIDVEMSIPMWGAQLSYNAAVAAVLVLYEIMRRIKVPK
ncbi:MAG: RNA methyltransferase [Candidatus Omnitrophica bacterium]|nr:RNA methyltransferase [Candidatus Omnitrophota bacterium]